MRLPGITGKPWLDRFGPWATLSPCSPAALSGERGIQSPGSRRPFLPRGLDRGPERGSLPSAPRKRPQHPARLHPNSVDPGRALHGGARLPYRAAAPGGSSAPRRAGHFFSGKLLSGSAGLSRGGQEKRSAPGGCDHPGTSPRCEPSPSARVLPLRPPPHADAEAAAGPSPFALAAPCPPRLAGPEPGLGSPRGGGRGVRTWKGYPTEDAVPRDCLDLWLASSPPTTRKAFSRHLHSAPESEGPALRNLKVSIHFKSRLLNWSGPTEAQGPRASQIPAHWEHIALPWVKCQSVGILGIFFLSPPTSANIERSRAERM